MCYRTLLMLALMCLPGALAAAATEPVESIRAAVMGMLQAERKAGVEVEVVLDPALRMPRCAEGLQAKRSGNATVEVSCQKASGWRLFVPVRLRRQQTVLVLTRALAAGEAISAGMLAQETRDTSRIVGAPLSDPASAIGQVARRALAAGSVLAASHLRAPSVVARGEQVMLFSRRHGIEVRMPGRALVAGSVGERINVENLSSKRRVQGVVMDNGDVEVVH